MPRMPDPELVAAWKARLERFEHSQLTVAEFCEVEDVSVASFYQWRRKLEQPQSPASVKRRGGEFIAVQLRSSSHQLRLSLPGGATIELTGGIDPAHLRELIAAVVDVTAHADALSTGEK